MTMRFSTRVENLDVLDDIEAAIAIGIVDGGKEVAGEAEDVARQRIIDVGAIWRGILVESFDWTMKRRGNTTVFTVKNLSDHAAPIEFGAEYGEKGPPVASLIPWVETKLAGFNIPNDELSNLPDPDEIDTEVEISTGSQTANADLTELADRETIQKAFWVQQHIKEHGIDAVRFMKAAEMWAAADGGPTVAAEITKQLERL